MSMIANFLRVSSSELEDYKHDSTKLQNRIYGNDNSEDDHLIDIEKAWAGIMFLLTGETIETMSDNLWRVIYNPQLIDENQDLGYGPASYLTAEQVKELNSEISDIKVKELKKNFDPDKMLANDVYPAIWDEDDSFDYLLGYFDKLQGFYKQASENNEAVISFMN